MIRIIIPALLFSVLFGQSNPIDIGTVGARQLRMGDQLNKIQLAIIEVNRDEVYESCPMIEDIDLYLEGFGFERLAVEWQSESWGDAIYVKH